jgi:cytochrome b involved in lipid metabolism
MDWIRLTKSGKDLTGLKGGLIEVTEEELKKHNKKEDCWICIRGKRHLLNISETPGLSDLVTKIASVDHK